MELRGPNPDGALADLYDLLVRGLGAALGGDGGGVETNFGDFAQEALIKITDNLDSFRGESRFTTWAQKIVEASAVMPLVRDHLDKCADCRSKLEALLTALRGT